MIAQELYCRHKTWMCDAVTGVMIAAAINCGIISHGMFSEP